MSLCAECGCCEAYVCNAETASEEWTDNLCLWCSDGVPCPNAQQKKRQLAAQKAAADVTPPSHGQGVTHFAGASKVSRAYQPQWEDLRRLSKAQTLSPRSPRKQPAPPEVARPIPTTNLNGDTMPKNNIEELRNDLFDTLRSLKGDVKEVDIKRALAVCAVAGTIINTGKLELDVMKKAGTPTSTASSFFGASAGAEMPRALNAPPEEPKQKRIANGKAS